MNSNLGRHELLQWINNQMQTQYTSVQMLGDGIAYSQMLDAIHPGSINIFKLNLTTKYPQDCLRNIKLVEDGLKKLKITQPVSFQKIGRGKFHDNIVFLQWLYGYSNRHGQQNLMLYNAYERRLQILQKQGKSHGEMNNHLLPNQAYYEDANQWQAGVEGDEQINVEQYGNIQGEVDGHLEKIGEYVKGLEMSLKVTMEQNWKLMHLVDKSIEERNCLYLLLNHIDKLVEENKQSPLKQRLQMILHQTPASFQ